MAKSEDGVRITEKSRLEIMEHIDKQMDAFWDVNPEAGYVENLASDDDWLEFMDEIISRAMYHCDGGLDSKAIGSEIIALAVVAACYCEQNGWESEDEYSSVRAS